LAFLLSSRFEDAMGRAGAILSAGPVVA
jgi:hypothetical protein